MKAGRDPMAFVALLGRLTDDEAGEKKTGWLSTHPSAGDRAKMVEEQVRRLQEGR